MNEPTRAWQVQQAKARFSALVRAAQTLPQIITMHGQASAVMISYPLYRLMIKAMDELNRQAAAEKSGLTSQGPSGDEIRSD